MAVISCILCYESLTDFSGDRTRNCSVRDRRFGKFSTVWQFVRKTSCTQRFFVIRHVTSWCLPSKLFCLLCLKDNCIDMSCLVSQFVSLRYINRHLMKPDGVQLLEDLFVFVIFFLHSLSFHFMPLLRLVESPFHAHTTIG